MTSFFETPSRTADTLYQQFETNFHRNETAGLVPNFYIHVSVSDL